MKLTPILWACATFATVTTGLNVLITNDDGFGVSNIRELYKAMKALGHNCYIVASTSDQSGMGGRAVFTSSPNLTTDTEWGIVKAGAPSVGTDPNDSHIWYYNGTPAAQVFVALDYVLPNFGDFSKPDLVLAGPNFGLNLGPFLYTLSGTIGATYAAVERGIPAIAYSGAYSVQTPYYWTNTTTKAGLQDPATIYGRLAASLAQALINKAAGGRILPLGYGISVNLPYITSFTNDSCVNPPFILARMTGLADVDKAAYNASTGLFTYQNVVTPGANQCINGDCDLPGETAVLSSGCLSSVTVFSVDYDAPWALECRNLTNPYSIVPSIVQSINSTKLVGGLGVNASVTGGSSSGRGANSSYTATAVTPGATSSLPAMSAATIAEHVSMVAMVVLGFSIVLLV